MTKHSKPLHLCVWILLLAALSLPVFAATKTANVSGYWDADSVWGGSVPADSGDSINIGGTNATKTDVSTNNTTVSTAYFRIGTVARANASLTVGGPNDSSIITIASGDASVARSNYSEGFLYINENGKVESNIHFVLGFSNSSYGTVDINGGSLIANRINIGNNTTSGGGELNIYSGILETAASGPVYVGNGIGNDLTNGNAKTSGPASLNIYGGEVTIRSTIHVGGKDIDSSIIDKPKSILISDGNVTGTNLYIGSANNTTASATIEGGNITLSSQVRVGQNGNGTMSMSGGNISASEFRLGVKTNANVTATTNLFTMEGGNITTNVLAIGNRSNTTNTFTVKGGNITVADKMTLGNGSSTTLVMENGTITTNELTTSDAVFTTNLFSISGGEFTANNVNMGNHTNSTSTIEMSNGTISAREYFMMASPSASTITLNISGGLLKTDSGADLTVGRTTGAGRSKVSLNMSGGRLEVGGDLYVGRGPGTIASTNSLAGFLGNSNVSIAGALNLAFDGAINMAEVNIGDQATLTANGLSLKSTSRLLFKVGDPGYTASLNVNDHFSSESRSRIVIDLSGFTSGSSGRFNANLMGYTGAIQADAESIAGLYLGPLNRGISNAAWNWQNGANGRTLSLSFDYTATPVIGEVPNRIRHNAKRAIRALTANIRGVYETDDPSADNSWVRRRELCRDVLLAQNADIIGIQEGRNFSMGYLDEQLTDYAYVCPLTQDAAAHHPTNPIFYSSSRFEVLDQGGFWLSATPDVESKFEESGSYRLANWVKLEDKTTGLPLYVINTHLDNEENAGRVLQMGVLLDFTKTLPTDIPVLIIGDFNCGIDSDPNNLIMADGWIDSYASVHGPKDPGMTAHDFFGDDREDADIRKKIDFVFHNTLFTPIEAEVIKDSRNGYFPSDHYFVSAELQYVQEPLVTPPPYNNKEELILYALTDNYTVNSSGNLVATNPGSTEHLPQLQVGADEKTPELSFTPLRESLTYEVQQSTDLQTWTTIESFQGNSSLTEPIAIQSDNSLDNTPRLFLRLKISEDANSSE